MCEWTYTQYLKLFLQMFETQIMNLIWSDII